MGNEPSDNNLMTAYVKGDEQAFTLLFGRYSKKLTTFLRYRLGAKKSHLLEEIFQKTWLKTHSGRKSFNPAHKFSTWFYTISLNTLRDEVGALSERTHHEGVSEELPDHQANSEEQYISKQAFEQIECLFKFLSDNQKTALLLSDQEELSSKEIAEIMNISDSAARQLISRARKVIRLHLLNEVEK